jgi:hypothetical protein
MTEERSSTALFAVVGLLAPVIAAWVLLFAVDSLDSSWLLAGVLALGAGMMIVNVIQRIVPGVFVPAFAADEAEDEPMDLPEVKAIAAVEEDDEDADIPAPRLRVLIASSGLQGLSVALLTAYFMGDVAVSVAVGVIFGALGIGVSMLLARKLSAATDPG